MRIGIAIVAEYESLVTESSSELGWAIENMKSVVYDLVGSLMADDSESLRNCTHEFLNIADNTFGYT